MFSTAKTVQTKKTAAKKNDKRSVEIEGLAQLASIDAVIKALTALKTTIEGDVKSAMAVEFITEGCAAKKRPENFRGIETTELQVADGEIKSVAASASCELRIRSSASALSDAEVETLTEAGIATQEAVSVVETYVVNPAYKDNGEILGLVEKKLKGVKGIPEDFIQFQPGEKKTIVGPDALDTLFTLPAEKARDLLSVVGVLAIKPKLDNDDVGAAFEVVQGILG